MKPLGARSDLADIAYRVLCTAFMIAGLWAITLGRMDPWLHRVMFLGFVLPLALLGEKTDSRWLSRVNLVLAVAAGVASFYLLANGPRFITRWPMVSALTGIDQAVGLLLIALTLWLTWRLFGMCLVYIIGAFIAYSFLGPLLPGILHYQGMTLKGFVDQNVYTITGLMGVPVGVATTYIFSFITFGAILHQGGGGDFFFKLANAVAGKAVGGPAKVGIIASGLYGMISGSAVSDAATTGSFTIPVMKRVGFSPTFAAAVEAVAATGGGIMPPVMSSAAFLMAELTGIPYVRIAAASALPALLYYLGLYCQIHYRSLALGMKPLPQEQIEPLGKVLKENFQHLIPLVALVWLLLTGMEPALTAWIASALAVATSWLRRETRIGPKELFAAVQTACRRIVGVTSVCAAAGLVIGGITFTGLGGKFLSIILGLSGGSLFLALVIAMIVSIIVGLGIPAVPAYALSAALIAPALVELGLPVMTAHLFVLYYAVLSTITPPVAETAYVTAGIAGADPTATGFLAMRLGILAFIVPMMFAFAPVLTLQGSWVSLLLVVPTAVIGTWLIGIGLEGWFSGPMRWPARILFLLGGGLLVYPALAGDILGVVLVACGFFMLRREAGLYEVVGRSRGCNGRNGRR